MPRDSYILYLDEMHNTLSELSDEEAGKLIKAIQLYEESRDDATVTAPTFEDRALRMTLKRITEQLDRDAAKYAKKSRERIEAGRIGGKKSGEARRKKSKLDEANEAIASKMKQHKANEAVTVTDTVTDTDTDTASVTDNASVTDAKNNAYNGMIDPRNPNVHELIQSITQKK